MIWRDIVTSYKQTVLGPLWLVIQALMGSAVFTIIFGNIAGLSTDGHPSFLFYLCGNLGWQYFAKTFGIGCNALQTNVGIFSKVYFPRLIPPFTSSISALLDFGIQLAVLLLAILIYNYSFGPPHILPSYSTVLLPLLVFQTILLGLGTGFIISSISVKYRDIGRLGGLISQFIMYASPVIYPLSEIPNKYQHFLAYNPLTFIIESYRYLLLGKSLGCTWEYATPSILITVILFLAGTSFYNRTQKNFVDYA